MNKQDFENVVRKMMDEKPILFALESDNKASAEMIEIVEGYYGIKFPDSYKGFVSEYGGGYFGFIVVYSCDCNGMFYIKNIVSKEWVLKKSFLPVVDFETGDLLGFEIENGVCRNVVSLYLHEENELHLLEMDFYDAILEHGLKAN